jgi:Flp pilus assembly protein TadD
VRSVSLEPGNGYAQNLLGLTRLRQGRPSDAVEPLRRAVEAEPDVAYVHNNLGMALELGGERDAAIAAYREAVRCDPAHERAGANLARLGGSVEESPVEVVSDPPAEASLDGLLAERSEVP